MRHPVLRLDFSDVSFHDPDTLRDDVTAQLDAIEAETGATSPYAEAPARFHHLVQTLHERSGQRVAVLVDEYDKPILDALDTPEVARAHRDFLLGLYSVVKGSDAHIHFTLLTGVSKFFTGSLFSGLNNLIDITLDPRYSAICGYTDADLDQVFAPELPGLDRDQIRDWYNGYSWASTSSAAPLGDEKVYNPFDILLLFDKRQFGAYWFETKTPTFLVETLCQRRVSSFELGQMLSTSDLLMTFNVDDIATEALLFLTGYLTITQERNLGVKLYRLGYPNRAVRQSLNESLLRYLVRDEARQMANSTQLYDLLLANDFAGLKTLFHAFFASIPYKWYTNNDIAGYEGYYASVFYSYFAALGLDITVEDSSSHGRLDMAVLFNDHVYLFEFKVVEMASAGAALAQLQERRYADKYHALGQPIYLIALEFSKDERNIAAFDVESA